MAAQVETPQAVQEAEEVAVDHQVDQAECYSADPKCLTEFAT